MTSKLAMRAAMAACSAVFTFGVAGASNDGPALPAGTQDSNQAVARDAVADFGTGVNILQIPAAAFTVRNAAASLEYLTTGYIYQSAGLVDSSWAPFMLPAGAGIQYLDLYAYDTSASNISATIRMWTGYGSGLLVPTVAPSFTDLVTVTSSGTGGYQYVYSNALSPLHTVNNDVVYGGGQQYSVVITTSNVISLGWKGVDIWWFKQTAPAPATASFTDVPVGAQFFKEVEALAKSGITAGCTATTFCPEQAVTRRQMAAFLSRALGLGFSH
jgi:hypothetical protein